MKTKLNEILASTHHSIIVSCQALPGEPLYCEEISLMPFMAKAAMQAGARCIRTSSVRDVAAVKEETNLPVIGLIKRQYDGFESYITTTIREIDELVAVESDIIALDCTGLKRGDGLTINQFISQIKDKYPDIVLMADISTLEEGINAWNCGVDIVGTTMSGYTPFSRQLDGPDFELAEALVKAVSIPVIAEGRIHTPQQAKEMLSTGVHAVVIGGAITRPLEIAKRFFEGIQ
ncbi:MAG: N-acetylmannosamine-6-phosphate 2-epimerase [Ruminococcus flavefaciens]|nr:N-acetylmannosamine-6-phosphate 2-epimerase [Ruminococcus flavefaciens]